MTASTVAPPIHVLLVEDNPGDARLILEMLKEADHELFNLERVDRLKLALDRLNTTGVDVVLLDLGLPDSTGLATFERTHHVAPREPIVVISGLDDERVALEAVRAGAQDYLVKGRIEGRLLARVLRHAIERKRSEDALRSSEAHYRAILENIGDAVFVISRNGHYLDVNPRACEMTGYSRLELLRLTTADTYAHEEQETAGQQLAAIAGGKLRAYERQLLRKDGTEITVDVSARVLPDGRLLATLRDVTERRQAERALRESDQRFREIAQHIREAFFVVDPVARRTVYVSPTWSEIWGRPEGEAYRDANMWSDAIHPDDRPGVLAGQEGLAKGTPNIVTFRVIRPDGSIRWVRGRAFPVMSPAGTLTRIVGVAEDITELKQTEHQLLQAQKMEAIGRLAGGVAHDFNNALTAIMGYTDMVLQDLPDESEAAQDLTEVKKAAQHAAGLTRQLLAFSRQQVLEPVVMKVNDHLQNFQKMLRRVIGEDIQLRLALGHDIGNVRVDPGQLEQVLMNLVVNARDAMPLGGELVIETANAELSEEYADQHQPVVPGAYVMIAVSDTGQGMKAEVKARIFEPFFTTKETGHGTGLGLSTVYGIVKQSGGYIWVYSEEGNGTTFKVYLPIVDSPPDAPVKRRETSTVAGTETILLAEDDAMIRPLTKGVLTKLGYTVMVAADLEEAMRLAAGQSGTLHLLITDVVMPGGSGRDLARQLTAQRPDLKVLYISGYTDDAISRHGMLEPGLNFLQKPFTPAVLARKVREVLDSG